ncbi:MAG: DcaP family trimeric outer membrane transporter [Gammaproteobacteria bacterium]|nr:porin [Pseudomonadales bacterium]MCP5347437.1 porin [Pseudomonadales bacterium]
MIPDRAPGNRALLLTLLLGLLLTPDQSQAAEPPDLSMGGFFRLQLLSGGISADRNRSGDSELWIPDIPVTPQPTSNWKPVQVHARESRLWVRAVQETPLGQLEALVEGDLDADRHDGHDPRLRHAYLILGPLLVGQTYTTFTNTSALADIDAGIAVGNVVTRHRLIRWQQSLGTGSSFSLALEDSLNRLHFSGTNSIVSTGDRRPPDLVMRFDRNGDWGNASVSLLLREITTTEPPGPGIHTDTELGSALSFAGRIATGGLDNLRFMFNYGDALARYSTLSTFADASVTAAGQVRLTATHSGLLAWQHFWAPRWRSTLALSYSRADPHRSTSGKLSRESRSGHANLIWTPTQRVSLGIEYLYGWRSLINGDSGNLDRLQLTTRINF